MPWQVGQYYFTVLINGFQFGVPELFLFWKRNQFFHRKTRSNSELRTLPF
jgi:hypothetical protein